MELLKKNLKVFDKYGIVYQSITLLPKTDANGEYMFDPEHPDRLKKASPPNLPLYKNQKLTKNFKSDLNATIVLTGDAYNLIGIDIDNKDDTLQRYQQICDDNNYDRETLTIETINIGFHEYYKLTEDQQSELKNFSNCHGKFFGLHIDIKYNNQYLYGPGYIEADKVYTYKVSKDVEPIILPDFLFKEILNHIKPIINKPNKKKQPIEKQPKKKEKNIKMIERPVDNDIDARLEAYISCLNPIRFKIRDDWILIGLIIFNVGGSFELWDKVSKGAPNYDSDDIIKDWKSFKKEAEKKVGFPTLIRMAKEDNYQKYMETYSNDKIAIMDSLFLEGPNDINCSYLFYCLYPKSYIYDSVNKIWYKLNEYGILINDNDSLMLKDHINKTLFGEIEKEFIRRNTKLTDDSAKTKLTSIYISIRKYLSQSKNKNSMVGELRSLYLEQDISRKLNNINNYIIAFENGVYDLNTDKFRIALPEEYVSCTTEYRYEPSDTETINDLANILKTIMPDPDELRYLLKTISLGLIGVNKLEELYIWIGSGRNGKGLLRDLISGTLGNYYDSMEIEYLCKSTLQTNGQSADPVMASKKNCRLVISSEPEDDADLKTGKIKHITGRDEFSVRELYGKMFKFTPKFKLIIQTNDEIRINGTDQAMIDRLRFIKFPIRFVDEPKLKHERKIDKTLKERLNTVKYKLAFFHILLEHYKDFIANDNNKLVMPPRLKADTLEYLSTNDPIKEFIDDKLLITENNNDTIGSRDLFDGFREYTNDSSDINCRSFKKIMKKKGYNPRRTNRGIIYSGLKFKDDDEDGEANALD